MKITPGDHISQRREINGYPVTLRFSPVPAPHISAQIKQILLSSITLDCEEQLWDDCADQGTDQKEKEESE